MSKTGVVGTRERKAGRAAVAKKPAGRAAKLATVESVVPVQEVDAPVEPVVEPAPIEPERPAEQPVESPAAPEIIEAPEASASPVAEPVGPLPWEQPDILADLTREAASRQAERITMQVTEYHRIVPALMIRKGMWLTEDGKWFVGRRAAAMPTWAFYRVDLKDGAAVLTWLSDHSSSYDPLRQLAREQLAAACAA